ncbi:transposase [Aquabacterium sp.]|uniref:transposase n=1 Tax=Aquabacterium sp. TaxID=1872578 RepID=UPI003BB07554
MDTMQSTQTKRTRRRHAPDLKRQVVLACQQPGASVAGVALAHGLNANLVRRWLQCEHKAPGALSVVGAPSGAFVEVPMPRASAPTPEPIRLELRRGASTVSLQWPATAAADCGAWLREWLR